MMSLRLVSVFALAGAALAQLTSFSDAPGTRSLWIPYMTISGVPEASVIHDSKGLTTYEVHCPTSQTSCALGDKFVLTEGTDLVKYTTKSTSGKSVETSIVECPLTHTPVVCDITSSHHGGKASSTSSTVSSTDMVYMAVDVTALSGVKATATPATDKSTATGTQTSSTTGSQSAASSSGSSTSSKGGAEATAKPLGAVAGMLGAGVLALAAL